MTLLVIAFMDSCVLRHHSLPSQHGMNADISFERGPSFCLMYFLFLDCNQISLLEAAIAKWGKTDSTKGFFSSFLPLKECSSNK